VNDDVPMLEQSSLTDSAASSSASSQSNSVAELAPTYTSEDVHTIAEMFPHIDQQIIVNLLDKHGGNKDLAVNELLQSQHD
jgi:hypothetical protein